MIIDCHVHMSSVDDRNDDYSATSICAQMDRYGIDKAIVFPKFDLEPDNVGLARIIKAYQGRFVGFAWLNPQLKEQVMVDLEKAVDLGFSGIKLHPLLHAFFPKHPYLHKVMERAQELHLPVTIHSGHAPFSLPSQIASLAQMYPGIPVIMDHMGMQLGYVDEAIQYARDIPNLYLGTTAMPFHKKIAEAVAAIGSERVLFGSDAPVIHPLVEMQRVKVAGLSAKDEAMVLGGTAQKLLEAYRV